MSDEFNFGSMRKSKFGPAPDPKSETLTEKRVNELAQDLIGRNLTAFKTEIRKMVKSDVKQVKTDIISQLDAFKDNAKDVWKEIYPTLVKMWGTSNGIGKKIAKLDLLLENTK